LTLHTSSTLHFVFECIAYFAGMRYFLYLRAREERAPSTSFNWVVVGAILGAAVGSKLVFWLHRPDLLWQRLDFLPQLMVGKTVLGGFLGGVIGVEIAKKSIGRSEATGDLFVFPILVGLMIGRIGCFFGGLDDGTYGLPSALPWAVDFGDGIPRHPTQLYELLFAAACFVALKRLLPHLPRPGDGFKLFMTAYLAWRFAADFFKPRDFLYFHLLSGIQLASLAGLVYYLPHSLRIGGACCRQK